MSIGGAAHRFLRQHVRLMGSVLSVKTSEPHIVLTYDDGPEPGGTERILDALAERGAHATFFILTRRARAHPGMLADVIAAGHEVALHGPDHVALDRFTPREVFARTSAARDELEDLSGRRVRWVRPPYGRQSPLTYLALRRTGLMPVLWSASLRDTVDGTATERVDTALSLTTPGAILLAHDGRADAHDGVDDPPITPFDRGDLARRLLDAYADRGLNVTSLDRALRTGSVRKGAWFG